MSDASKAAGRPSRPSLLLGAAHLAALWALAFLQPMLALLGDNPEFFVARGNTAGQIVVYALALAFVPPLIGLLIEYVASRFGDLVRWRTHLLLMSLVGAALALQILKRVARLARRDHDRAGDPAGRGRCVRLRPLPVPEVLHGHPDAGPDRDPAVLLPAEQHLEADPPP